MYLREHANISFPIHTASFPSGFSAAEIAQLRTETAAGVQVLEGPGAEIHYLVFDVSKAPADKLAVRQAVAQVIDRAALASTVYADTVTPLYSLMPAALQRITAKASWPTLPSGTR